MMKTLSALFLCLLMSPKILSLEAKERQLRFIENKAFSEGEILKFKLHYGFINAGIGELRVMDNAVNVGGNACWHVVATGRSISTFDWFYKVRDRYETYIDREAMVPWRFIRDVYEGGYEFKDQYSFDQQSRTVLANGEKFEVPKYTQDIVSSFYFARTLDFKYARKGDTFEVPMFLDKEIHHFKFRFMGRETLDLGSTGKFKVMVFMPVVMKGRVFKNENDLIVYVSDDENKIPLQIKANILIGSVKMTMTDYSGLRNPMHAKIR
jgi:hypothetical protein